jgi:hypothetical protein
MDADEEMVTGHMGRYEEAKVARVFGDKESTGIRHKKPGLNELRCRMAYRLLGLRGQAKGNRISFHEPTGEER